MNLDPDQLANAVSTARVIYVVRGCPDPRQPLPAGHPESWGAITRGTMLEGAAYPHPVFGK